MGETDPPNKSDPEAGTAKESPKGPTVVGIGASAGGLSALKKFFAHVPAESGLAFVVVVHLSPEHPSHLADLLQPSVRFPVQQVTENTPIERDRVYVIPPNANLSAIDTHLRLSELEERRRERAPIDRFFRTLASTHDGHAVGVVLTGTGSDGTLGIKEIKAKGGLVVVQDPNEAEYDGMPQSAIATGLVDRILPVATIPEAILRFNRTQPRIGVQPEGAEAESVERQVLPRLFAVLRTRTDRDFTRYRRTTILRRISRRMQLNYMEDPELYLEKLREQPEEARALADDLLITVTSFFRDPQVFERLRTAVIPHLFDRKSAADAVRVWSVGCATGEEAYSLAILFKEEASRREVAPKIQIFASDLHKGSLAVAREGLYAGDIEADVNHERLSRFFRKENGGYRVQKEIRDLVVFSPHNLLADPPFSKLDLIACRNLLIYLERDVQGDVIELFHYALGPDGYLVLGSAETLDATDLFRVEDKKLCLYRKRNVAPPEPRLPVFPISVHRGSGIPPARTGTAVAPPAYGSLHQQMVEQYAPPSILVNSEDKIVHLSDHAGRYLVHPGGELTSDIYKVVREELRLELRVLLQSSREQKLAMDSDEIAVRFNGHVRPVVMLVRPSLNRDQEGFALIIFDEREPQDGTTIKPRGDAATQTTSDRKRIDQLESELNESRHRFQTLIEEYEASREEMKAANEELQSTNEELRATMEELETSKEELQSINEELQTVNQENRHKVEELSQLSGDLQNLLAATDIATLFLDRTLRILRFTPKLGELFNVRVTDRGRPISDLTHRLGYAELRNDAAAVLEKLIPVEREVQDDAGRWYLTRVLPYRSADDRIEGVVITFIDITDRKRTEEALTIRERDFNTIANLVPDLLWKSDPHGANNWYSQRWFDYTGQTLEQAQGFGWTQTLHPDDREEVRAQYLDSIRIEQVFRKECRIKSAEGDFRWFLVQARPSFDNTGRLAAWFAAATDVNEERLAMDAVGRALAEEEALLKEVHHRVKNNLQIIMSLLNLQVRQIDDQRVISAFEVARHRVQSIASIHELLYRSESFAAVELGSYARRLVPNVVQLYGGQERLQVDVVADSITLEIERAVPLGLILNELVTNACKHAFPNSRNGVVAVKLAREPGDEQAILTVADTGVGLPSDFDYDTAKTVGMNLVRSLARQLRAKVDVRSGEGTQVEVRFPLQTVTDEEDDSNDHAS